MNANKSLSLIAVALAAASVLAQVTPPATTTTFTAATNPQIVNAANWDNGAPVTPVIGLIDINGAINANPDNYSVVQTAGTVTYVNNRVWNNVTWYQTGGIFGSGVANINNGTGFLYYALAGEMSVGVMKLTGGSQLYIENAVVSNTINTQMNDGTILFGAGSGSFTTPDLRNLVSGSSVINFLPGTLGSFTATNITDFEALWNNGILKYNGANSGAFADHFEVTGSTLTLAGATPPAVPSPTAIAGVSAGKLTITFDRVADETLLYEVLSGNDLSTWGSIWTSTGVENVAGPVSVDDTETLTAGSKRFLKLEVTRP